MRSPDNVAIINPIPRKRLTLVEPNHISIQNFPPGQVGTVVAVYEGAEDYHYLVEFADTQGREYAMATLRKDELLGLHYELSVA